jgi:hypothetical protein
MVKSQQHKDCRRAPSRQHPFEEASGSRFVAPPVLQNVEIYTVLIEGPLE